MNIHSSLFGDQGIVDCLSGAATNNSGDLVARVVAAVQGHQAGAPQADDITLVALRRVAG